MMKRLGAFLAPPTFSSEADRVGAYLLNVITLSLLAVVAPVSVAAFVLTTTGAFPTTPQSIFARAALILIPIVLPQLLLRSGRLKAAGYAFIGLLWLVFGLNLATNSGMQQLTYANFIILILSAGMILGVRAGIVTAVLSIAYGLAAGLLVQQGILPGLDQVQEPLGVWISGSALFVLSAVLMTLFVRQLNESVSRLRTVNSELVEVRQNLNTRIGQRTRDLELAAEVSRSIATDVPDLDQMLQTAVDLVQSRFSLYYVQLYLLDERGLGLEMRAGTGDVGRILHERGHRLAVGPGSINGATASSGETIIVPDTEASLFHRANSLLPATRSEMAVPLKIESDVIGVLDVQSDTVNALSDENQTAFEVLAGQLAISIRHARLVSEIRSSQAELERFAQQQAEADWSIFFDGVQVAERIGYAFHDDELVAIDAHPAKATGRGVYQADVEMTGNLVGSIQIDLGNQRELTEEEQNFVSAVGRRVAAKVDNIRLAVEADHQRENASLAQRRLTNDGWRDVIRNSWADRPMEFEYDQVDVHAPQRGLMAEKDARVIPIEAGNAVLGNLMMDATGKWDQATHEMIEEITSRLGQHVENLRLSEQSAKRAAELETVARVSTATSTILDTEQLLQAVVDLTKSSFDLYHAHIYLMSADERYLYIAAGSGSIGTSMVAEGRRLSLLQEQSLVARAARDRSGIVVNDVHQESGFLAHPLLPYTRAELAVPLLVGDRVLGVFDVQSEQVNRFGQQDINIQTTLASQVAVALQNARLYQDTRIRAAREETINDISQKIQSTASVEAALQTAIRELGNALDAKFTTIELTDAIRGRTKPDQVAA
jgi:GAF domain-containing protein